MTSTTKWEELIKDFRKINGQWFAYLDRKENRTVTLKHILKSQSKQSAKDINDTRKEIVEMIEGMKINALPAPLTKKKIIAGIKIQAHDKALTSIINKLKEEGK